MNDTKSAVTVFYCIKCIETFEADSEVYIKQALGLQFQSYLSKILMY